MDNRRPKKMSDVNVAAVRNFCRGYSTEQMHGVQQILGWFGDSPKLERILYAILKEKHIEGVKHAEELHREYYIRISSDEYDSDIGVHPDKDIIQVYDLKTRLENGEGHTDAIALFTEDWFKDFRAAMDELIPTEAHEVDSIEALANASDFIPAAAMAGDLMTKLKVASGIRFRQSDPDIPPEDRKKPVYFQEPVQLPFVVGMCPRCSNIVRGMPLPSCESKKSGRVFYKECAGCSYYSEVIMDRTMYKELEEG